jgi:E3 ubiquitin-protein ligase UHRF1
MECLDPPLDTIPEDDWYCPDCKNDASEIVQVTNLTYFSPPCIMLKQLNFMKKIFIIHDLSIFQAGELGNKFSHRQSKMPSRQKGGNKRDWGKGLATAGRSKTCTLVPNNHFGPIPG